MELRALGPLEAVDGERVINLPWRGRQILERLVAARRRPVPDEVMIDAIWGDRPPRTARKTLQGQVHRIRATIGEDTIVRVGDGYALAPTVDVDVEDVEGDLAIARDAVAERHFEVADDHFARALCRFRGEPMHDLPDDAVAVAFRSELLELELSAHEEHYINDLALGRHRELVGPLEALAARDPTRERTWCLLIEALARSGRQADALDAFGRAKRALAQHLGIEPGTRLRELERAVLEQRLEPGPTRPAIGVNHTALGAPLVGRDAELGRIAGLLSDARGSRGGALLLRGEPGIGKTALVHRAAAIAEGFTVVSSTGVESEAELGFAALRDLLRPISALLPSIPGALAGALEAALAIGPGVQRDRLSVSVGALELCRTAAVEGPLALLIDDFHWVDRASGEVVRYLARRLGGERIALVVTARGDRLRDPIDGAELVDVARLGHAESVALLRDHHDLPAPVAEVLANGAGGNPLALIETVRSLSPAQRSGADALPDPLPLGDRLAAAFGERIAGLPLATRRALLVVASHLGDPGQDLDTALDALGLARADLEPAERAAVVTYDRHTLRFTHPLMRSAVLRAATPPERRAALRAVALSEVNSERRAWGLALATEGRDEHVARLLEQVGDASASRLALSAATAAYARAARLGADGAAPRRLLQAVQAATAAGMYVEARELIAEILAAHADDDWRTPAELLLARIETAHGEPGRAVAILIDHAARLEGTAPDVAAVMCANAAMISLMPGRVRQALDLARRARELARGADDRVQAIVTTAYAAASAVAGDRRPTTELSLAAYHLANEPSTDPSRMFFPPAQLLFWCGRYADSRAILDPDIARCQEGGVFHVLPYKLACRAELAYLEGNWVAGRRDAEEAVEIATATGQANLLVFALVTLARFDAAQGATDVARQRADDALERSIAVGADSIRAYAAAVLGLADLADGDATAAVRHLREANDSTAAHGAGNPIVVPFAPDLIEALVRTGDRADADACIGHVERSDGAESDGWLAGVAARGRALLTPDHDAAVELLRRSVDHLGDPPLRFELGRSLLWLGRIERRRRRHPDARQAIESAIAIFTELDAAPWLREAEAQLVALVA